MHYMLFYDVEADFIEKRAQYRTEHLALAWQAHEKGELLLAGAVDEPIDTAVLLFQGASPAVAERFCDRRSLCQKRPRQELESAPVEHSGWRERGQSCPSESESVTPSNRRL